VINNNNFVLNFKGTSGDRTLRGRKGNHLMSSLFGDGGKDRVLATYFTNENSIAGGNDLLEGRDSNPTHTIPKIILATETNNVKEWQKVRRCFNSKALPTQSAFFTGLGNLEDSTASLDNYKTIASSNNGEQALIGDGNALIQDLGSLGGSVTQAYDICADGSKIVGYSHNGTHGEAFIWSRDRGMIGLGTLGSSFSIARAISSDGTQVVGCSHNGANEEAFIWNEKTGMLGLGHLGYNKLGKTSSVAYDICADGSMVVGYSYNGRNKEAFIWDRKTGMRSLKSVLSKCGLNLKGWQLTEAKTISDDGLTITGIGINPNGIQEAWMARLDARGGLLARLLRRVRSR
jgi:probable HAF family extracellular repeat protein